LEGLERRGLLAYHSEPARDGCRQSKKRNQRDDRRGEGASSCAIALRFSAADISSGNHLGGRDGAADGQDGDERRNELIRHAAQPILVYTAPYR
jgi:hypothetical protein